MTRAGNYLLAAGVGGNRHDADYLIGEIRKVVADAIVLRAPTRRRCTAPCATSSCPARRSRCNSRFCRASCPHAWTLTGRHFRAHVGSGVAQVAFDGVDAVSAAAALRSAAARARGHARVLSIGPELRGAVPFFDQPPAGAMKLMRGLKTAFDPAGIFNPGCFVGGL